MEETYLRVITEEEPTRFGSLWTMGDRGWAIVKDDSKGSRLTS